MKTKRQISKIHIYSTQKCLRCDKDLLSEEGIKNICKGCKKLEK